MDTSSPAVMVNGEVLRRYIGRRVRCVINVLRSDGGVLVGQTSDGHQISVKQAPPALSLSQFVEVIGVADTDRSVKADLCTNFGDNFGKVDQGDTCALGLSVIMLWLRRMWHIGMQGLYKIHENEMTCLHTINCANLQVQNNNICLYEG